MIGASLLTLSLFAAPAAETPATAEPETCGVVIAAPAKLKKRSIKRIRASLGITIKTSGFKRVTEKLLEKKLQPASDPMLTGCFEDEKCLTYVSEQLGASILLLVRLERKGGKFGGEVSMWSELVRSNAIPVAMTPRKRLSLKLAMAANDAIADFQGKHTAALKKAAVAAAAAEAAAAAAAEAAAAEAEILAATPAADAENLVAADEEFEDPTWERADDGGFTVGFGAFGAFSPLVHHPTSLRVGRAIPDNILGTGGAGLELRFRLPLLVEQLYLTVLSTYTFDDPLLAIDFGAGIEKRFDLGRLLPLIGARYRLALLGLPVPSEGGEGLALALTHGVEAYAGIAIELDPVPLALQLDLGYRLFPKPTNQFGHGGAIYYARDPDGEIWFLDPSGPTATLALIYEI